MRLDVDFGSGLGVNLGSGQRPFTSTRVMQWINVDSQPQWNPDIVADGAHIPMIPDGSVDIVVLHHCLEHFGCGEAAPMIRECHRILKSGGSLLVFVPNMRVLAERWLTRQLTDQIYFTNVYGAYMNDEADRHKWGYTRGTLDEFLRTTAEWATTKPFDWRDIPGASIARDFWILGTEAVR